MTGTSARILGLADAFAWTGNKSIMLSFEKRGRKYDSDSLNRHLHLLRLAFQFARAQNNIRLLGNAYRSSQFDVIHSRLFNLPYTLPLRIKERVRLIGDFHALSSLETENPIEKRYWQIAEKLACHLFDAIVVPTPELKEYLYRHYQARRIFVVPNSVTIPKVHKSTNSEKGKAILLFYHGTPYAENIRGLRRFVRLVHRLNAKGVEAKGMVAGSFSGLVPSKYVDYLGYCDDLDKYVAKAHVGVLPVRPKSLGIRSRALEYLRNGIPVVTTPEGATGLKSAVSEGVIRVCQDEDQMIKEIEEIIGNHVAIVQKAYRVIQDNYSPEVVGPKLWAVYKNVIDT